VLTGLGHGVGFGIYAFLAATGIATAMSLNATTVQVLRWGGILALVVLGYIFARQALSGSTQNVHPSEKKSSDRAGFAQGFFIAIFNPKILAWMLAIYAPFIDADLGIQVLLGMALMGMLIDATWYMSVATFFTTGNRGARLRSAASKLDGAMAVLMFTFAALLYFEVF
jgi:threonine/homoserine/homoserine lactone efflux protein